MTAFEFFAAAGFILGGVICLALAVLIVYGVIAGIKNHITNQREQRRLERGYTWKRHEDK